MTHTNSHTRKRVRTTRTTGLHHRRARSTRRAQARAHSVTHSFIHSAASLNARAARARTSEARVTPHAVHTRASFLKCAGHVSAPPPPSFVSPSSSCLTRLPCPCRARTCPLSLCRTWVATCFGSAPSLPYRLRCRRRYAPLAWTIRVPSWSTRGARLRSWSVLWAAHLVVVTLCERTDHVYIRARCTISSSGMAWRGFDWFVWFSLCGRRP